MNLSAPTTPSCSRLRESLMKDAGIHCFIADQGMSILEGSLGMLPRRLLVDEDDADEARRILIDAGLGGGIARA